MSAELPIYADGDTAPDLQPVQMDLHPIRPIKKVPQGLSTYIRKQTDTIVNLDQTEVDIDGAWNYTGRLPKPGEVVFMPASKDYITESSASHLNADLDSPFNLKSFLSFLILTAIAVGYFEYNKNLKSNQLASPQITYKSIPAVVQSPGQAPIIQVQESTNSLIENQISESQTLLDAPTLDTPPVVIDTFQDYQLEPEDTSVETAELFERDFQKLKRVILRLNIPRSRAHDHFNSSIFNQQLIDISNKYNTDQKMQVFMYLENLHIIPSSARNIIERNSDTMLKVFDYLRDFESESKLKRRERIKQRAYTLILRGVVERVDLNQLIFLVNAFNEAAQLSDANGYREVIEAIDEDSTTNLNPDKILQLEPVVTNGLLKDLQFYTQKFNLAHSDILTANTLFGLGTHETAPRLRVDNQERANLIVLNLLDYNPWNIVRFENGILTLGPGQLQDWGITFSRFPEDVQEKIIALASAIGIDNVTNHVDAMRAATLSGEIYYILWSSLLAQNYETLSKNIRGFENFSIGVKRRSLVKSNHDGAGRKGIRKVRECIKTANWGGYVLSVYKYIEERLINFK